MSFSSFGSSPPFGSSASVTGLFGSSSSSSNPSAASSFPFRFSSAASSTSSPAPSLFGSSSSAATASSASSPFGASSGSSIFGSALSAPAFGASIFGSSAPSLFWSSASPGSSLFGASASSASSGSSLFSSSSSAGASSGSSLFGAPSSAASSTPATSASQSSLGYGLATSGGSVSSTPATKTTSLTFTTSEAPLFSTVTATTISTPASTSTSQSTSASAFGVTSSASASTAIPASSAPSSGSGWSTPAVSSSTTPAFVVSTSGSAAPATSISSTIVGQTLSSLVVASTIGTSSTVGTFVTAAPKLSSEITGKTVEEEPNEQAPPNDSVQIIPREPFCDKEPLNTEVLPILPLMSQRGSTDNIGLVTHVEIPLPTSHVLNNEVIISSENQSLPHPLSLKGSSVGKEAASAIESPEGDVFSHVKTFSPDMGTFNIEDATKATQLIEGVIPDLDENRKALLIKNFIKYPNMMNMHPDWRSGYIKYMFMTLGDFLVLMSSITPMTLDEATRREIELVIIELERNNCDKVFVSNMKALISKAWDSHLSSGKHREELRILKKEFADLQARIRVLEGLLEQEKTPIFP